MDWQTQLTSRGIGTPTSHGMMRTRAVEDLQMLSPERHARASDADAVAGGLGNRAAGRQAGKGSHAFQLVQ